MIYNRMMYKFSAASWRFAVLILGGLFLIPAISYAATYDMASGTNWNIRWDGPLAGDWLSDQTLSIADVNGDGEQDIVVATNLADNQGRNVSGSIYVIYNNLFRSLAGSGNTIDLANPSNWNIRFDGPLSPSTLGFRPAATGDVDGDGRLDLGLSARAASTHGANSGAVYLVYGSLLDDYTGTGNILDLASSTNYNIRIDGASAGDLFGDGGVVFKDLDGDSKLDVTTGALSTDYNSRSGSGSVYVFNNTLLDDYAGTGNTITVASSTSYNLRFDGPVAGSAFADQKIDAFDFDGDDVEDLIFADASADPSGRTDAGSLWVVGSTIIDSYTGTGNNVDMASSTSYNVRFDGGATTDFLGLSAGMGDFNNDNDNDLMIGANGSDYQGSGSGSIYLIDHNILAAFAGTGNLWDMSNAASYSVRIDGATGVGFPRFTALFADFDNDGEDDIIAGSDDDRNSRNNSGSVYILPNTLFSDYTGTGNLLLLGSASTSDYIRFDGASAGVSFTEASLTVGDLNDDGSFDLLTGAYLSDNNSRTDSGSLFLVYNFPHTITASSTFTASGSDYLINGFVSASDSVSTIRGVEYQVDADTPTSGWSSCSAADGTFDATEEAFTCTIPTTAEGSHAVYFRAVDVNSVYTPQSAYDSATLIVAGTEEDESDDSGSSGGSSSHRHQAVTSPNPVSSSTVPALATSSPAMSEGFSSSATTCPYFIENLRQGSQGEEVSKVQEFLKAQGLFTYPAITQYFGPITESAVKAFQATYADDILRPLGLSAPTGWWYEFTRRKADSLLGCQ